MSVLIIHKKTKFVNNPSYSTCKINILDTLIPIDFFSYFSSIAKYTISDRIKLI